MVLYSYHIIMLSKIASLPLRAGFSQLAKAPTSVGSLLPQLKNQRLGLISGSETPNSVSSQAFQEQLQVETQQLNEYINETKSEIANQLSINFQDLTQQEVLVLDSPVGENNWKLAELITLGGSYQLFGLLAGFPSYAALVATLGVTGIGAALSYSNYLRRTSPQITEIKLNKAGKLHIFYLKPGFLQRQKSDFEVQLKSFSVVSFGCQYTNYLRKCNDTNWVSVDGNLFWYNNDQRVLRTNSHLYHKLF